MRFFLCLVLLVAILGISFWGLHVLGVNIPYVSQFLSHINMTSGNDNMGQQGQNKNYPGNTPGNFSTFNNFATQNRDKLSQATTLLNQAMEQITTDPYSQITLPNRSANSSSGTNSVNVPQRDGVTININPGEKQTVTPPLTGNVVYDQTKLEQLHNSIFKFSQAIMLLNELNNDLTDQTLLSETVPPTMETYIVRYNLTQQNRLKLTLIGRLLQEGIALANINPYAPVEGYAYNTQKMQQLHQGIFELAKSELILRRLGEDLNQQMLQIANEAKLARMQTAGTVSHGMTGANMQTGTMSSSWIVVVVLLLSFGIVLGVFLVIRRLFCHTKTA